MDNRRKFKWFVIVIVLLIFVCMITIFVLSAQDNTSTNILSRKVTERIAKVIFFDYDTISMTTQNEIIIGLNKFVRKLAHFTMYFMLGFYLFFGTLVFNFRNRFRFLIAAGICIAYAISDELHQLFVSGRTGQIRDVIIDSSGAFLGIICCFALFAVVEKALHKNIL